MERSAARTALEGGNLLSIPRALLSPPLPRWGILTRPRLLARLDRAFNRRLTLLTAPAGYGKTTLLASWTAGLKEQARLAWLTLDEASQEPLCLLGALGQALAGWLDDPTRQHLASLLADPSAGTHMPLTMLLNALASLSPPRLLILDDVHTVDVSPEAMAVLDRFLGQAPPGLRLVFAARRCLSLAAIPRLRAEGQVLDLGLADLRFTADEVTALFAAVLGRPLDAGQAANLEQRTEGWPVALTLFFQTAQQAGMDQAAGCLRQFSGATPQLYDYLTAVVLDKQPEPLRRFLLHTSILDQLEPEICEALLEQPNAAATLARLERRGLFTLPLDAGRSAYRYHSLFREFLQHRLLEEEGATRSHQLHRQAAALYLERNDDQQAIEHLLAARDYEAALDLLRPLQRLFPVSRHHLLERWLARFPPALAETQPWLLLTHAKLAVIRGERERARALFLQAEPLFQAAGDRDGLHDVYHDLANVVQDLGDFSRAVGLYRKALEYTEDDVQRAVLLGQIGRCLYLQGGQVDEALRLLDQAVELADRSSHPLGRAGLYTLQGKVLTNLGDFRGALDAFHTALNLMEEYGNRHQQISPLNNAAYLHCLLGEMDEAEPLARRAVALAETFDRPAPRAYALNILGEVRRRRGEYAAARACHLEALATQRQLNERLEIPVTLNWLGLLARREGNLDEALRWGEEGLALREKLGADYETGLSLIDLGATYLALGEWSDAAALWQRALIIFDQANARYELAQLHFYLAVLAQQQGDEAALDGHLPRAFELAHAFERGNPPRCLHFFIEEAAWSAPVLIHALRRGLAPRCVACLLPRLGPPAETALLALLDDDAAPVRARAAELLGRMASAAALQALDRLRRDPAPAVRQAADEAIGAILATPPPALRVHCLGRFCLWRGETEITHWGRSAARRVFCYLLAHRPRPVPMDQLMDAFWPDSGPAQARKNLHQAVAALRRALEPELAAGMAARYLRVGDDSYALNLPPGSGVDYEQLEARLPPLLAGPAGDPSAAESLAEVLALYGGDYLVESLYDEWTIFPRERLRNLYLTGLRRLAQAHLAGEQFAAAVAVASRALALDPWDEDAALLLMQAHAAQGHLPAALRAYETLRNRLRRDLDLPPRDDLTVLYNQLLGIR